MSTRAGVTITVNGKYPNYLYRHWDGYPDETLKTLLPLFKMIVDGNVPLVGTELEISNYISNLLQYMGHLEYVAFAGGKERFAANKMSEFSYKRVKTEVRVGDYYYLLNIIIEKDGKRGGELYIYEEEENIEIDDKGMPLLSQKKSSRILHMRILPDDIEKKAKEFDVDLEYLPKKINNLEFGMFLKNGEIFDES